MWHLFSHMIEHMPYIRYEIHSSHLTWPIFGRTNATSVNIKLKTNFEYRICLLINYMFCNAMAVIVKLNINIWYCALLCEQNKQWWSITWDETTRASFVTWLWELSGGIVLSYILVHDWLLQYQVVYNFVYISLYLKCKNHKADWYVNNVTYTVSI